MLYKIILLFVIASYYSCQSVNSDKLMIATAANMQFAMNEIIEAFEKDSGILCEAIISSSGKLTAQIIEGAPFDILVSADMKYPIELERKKLTTAPPRVYAYGQLVLWTLSTEITPTLNQLNDPNVHHIAMANPKTAPYGKAAFEILQKNGIYEDVESKLVYGESIAQTNQFIMTEAAEIGFTAKSVVLSKRIDGIGNWAELNSVDYSPIEQGVVILKHNIQNIGKSEKFVEFLLSSSGKQILDKFGYSIVE